MQMLMFYITFVILVGGGVKRSHLIMAAICYSVRISIMTIFIFSSSYV